MTLFPNRLHALFIFRQCGSDTLQGFSVVAGLGGGAFILRGEYCFFYAFIVYTAAMHTLPNAPPHPLLLRSRSESCHRFGGKGSKRMGFFGVGRSKTISLEGRFFFLGAPPPPPACGKYRRYRSFLLPHRRPPMLDNSFDAVHACEVAFPVSKLSPLLRHPPSFDTN